MKIFELFGSIFVESDKANESLDQTDNKAKNIVGSLGSGIKTAAKWTAGITAGAIAVGGAMLKAGEKFAETTDNIDKMSQKLGLSRQGFQEWDFILSQSGASIDSMKSGMTKLNNSFDELKNGSGAGAKAFERLNLSMDDLAGMSQEQIFEATIKALQGVSDESERAAIASDLLGKSAVELAPLLNSGAGSIDAMKQTANELGLILGDDAIDAGVKFTDTMDQIRRSLKALTMGFMKTIMPMLQDFLDFVQDNMPLIQEIMGDTFEMLGAAVESVMPLFKSILEGVLPPLIGMFSELGTNVIPILVSMVTGLVQTVLPIFIEVFNTIITSLLPPFVEFFNVIITLLLPPFIEMFNRLVQEVLPPLIEAFKTVVENLLPPLIDLFTRIIEAVLPVLIDLFNMFIDTILPPFIELLEVIASDVLPFVMDAFEVFADYIIPKLMKAFEAMKPYIEKVMNIVAGIIKTVIGIITLDWEGAWEGIKSILSNAWDAILIALDLFTKPFQEVFQKIAEVVKGIWDGLVENIKSGINWIIKGINSFIEGVNKIKIPNFVPGVGGKSLNIATIPLLEKGGEILKSGMAIVGEKGPEKLFLPEGAKVKPISRVEEAANSKRNGNIYQEVNIYSPKPLTPSEVGKQTKRASRKLAFELST
ncbi:MAG: hypothetical protein JXR88_12565 [Clostridia bacterium]|nr:hypothetical protein [Clostridia bacterium]